MTRNKLILIIGAIVIGASVVICALCGIVGLLASDDEESTPSTAEVVQAEQISNATSTPLPTPAPINTPTPESVVTEEIVIPQVETFDSGGLGLSKTEWEQVHTETELDYAPVGTGYDGKYDVVFQEGNVWFIERQWRTDDAITPDVVELESQNLIPVDSQLIETYSPEGRPETIVNLYLSESLKSRFSTDLWIGGEPGNFTVQYNVYDGKVTRLIITTGNNP